MLRTTNIETSIANMGYRINTVNDVTSKQHEITIARQIAIKHDSSQVGYVHNESA